MNAISEWPNQPRIIDEMQSFEFYYVETNSFHGIGRVVRSCHLPCRSRLKKQNHRHVCKHTCTPVCFTVLNKKRKGTFEVCTYCTSNQHKVTPQREWASLCVHCFVLESYPRKAKVTGQILFVQSRICWFQIIPHSKNLFRIPFIL